MTEPRIKHSIPDARWPTEAEAAASLWFSPTHIGRLAVEQRTWVPAMVPWRATEDGFVTAEVLDWYARFAEGRPVPRARWMEVFLGCASTGPSVRRAAVIRW